MTVSNGMNELLSRLQSGDQASFEQLATYLTSSQDQAARQQAEDIYSQLLEKQPDVAVRYLAAGLSQGGDMRRFSCVYLRKEAVKQKGMECLAAEHDKSLMRALADAMSTVAEQTWDSKDKWLGILESMHKFITSGDPHMIEAALMLFKKLTSWLLADDPVMVNMQRQMYDILLQFLTAAPNDDVRIAACQASTSFIASFENQDQMRALTSLVPPIVAVVTALLQKGEEEDARDVLVSLNEIAETEPLLFKPHFQQHAGVLLEVANNGDFDSETRQGALELLITVVEGKPALIRKDRVLLPKLCTTLLGMLLAIEDTEQWHAAVEEQDLDDGQDDLHEYSLQGLDRIAQPITGQHLLGTLWPLIEEWSKSGEWQRRHAALLTIAQVLLQDRALSALVNICCSAANDEHTIVKWCACQAIGQVCTDLQPKIQAKHHGAIVSALMRLMGPEQEPRVQAHASSAIVNFCEHLDANIMGLYLEQLLQRFQGLLGSNSQLVVEGGLTALSSVTDSAGELFQRYYSSVMPALKSILNSAMERKSHRRLCGKALECISLIAMAVGKDTFYDDARDFMNVLSTLTATDLEPDDPILTYVQTAGTRMCKCLGHEFVPLLPTFVPPLLKSAGKKSELQTVDAEDVDEEADDSQYYQLGDRTLRISTAHSEEKINALNMLSCYAEHLQEHFAPYCNDVATIVEHVVTVPLLNDEEMRGACAALMPPLLDAMQRAAERRTWASATPEAVRALYEQLMRALLKALDIEADNGVLGALYESVDQLVDGADQGLLDDTAMAALFTRADTQIGHLLAARAERGRDADEEEDLEQQQAAAEEEDAALEQIISAIGALLRRFGDAALPHVEAIAQKSFLGMASEPGRSSEDRWLAMLLISDMVEHAPAAAKYLPQLMPKFLEFAMAEKSDLCNVCCYSLGAVAEKHQQAYPEYHEQTLACITKVITATKGKDDWEIVADNSITALGKILRFHANLTGGDVGHELGKMWLDGLPIEEDEAEAGGQHALLHHFVANDDARILGKGQENLPRIADIFVRVIGRGSELLKDENVEPFQKFFFEQFLPVLQKQGFQLAQVAQALQPADQQRFVTAAKAYGHAL